MQQLGLQVIIGETGFIRDAGRASQRRLGPLYLLPKVTGVNILNRIQLSSYNLMQRILLTVVPCLGFLSYLAYLVAYKPYEALGLVIGGTGLVGIVLFSRIVNEQSFRDSIAGKLMHHPLVSASLYVSFAWALAFAVQLAMPEAANRSYVYGTSALMSLAYVYRGIRAYLKKAK